MGLTIAKMFETNNITDWDKITIEDCEFVNFGGAAIGPNQFYNVQI